MLAHRLPQAVVCVTRVVDGKQAPVLGVEYEEQAVEADQGRLAHGLQFCSRMRRGGQRRDQVGEDMIEDHAGQVLGNPLLVASPLGQGILQERGGRSRLARERLAPEQ